MATKKIDVEIDIRTNVDPVKAKLLELRRELQNTAEGSADFTNITNQIQELERSLGITEEQAKDLGDALEAAPNRIDVKGAGQRLRELQKELRNTQVGTARFNELSAEIRDTQDSLKAAKIGAEDFMGTLESMPGPAGAAARAFKQLQLAVTSLGGALRLAGIGIVVGLVAGISGAISRNAELQSEFKKTGDQVKEVFDDLLIALMPLFKFLVEITQTLVVLFKDVGKLIESETKRITIILQALNQVGRSLVSLLTGKFKQSIYDIGGLFFLLEKFIYRFITSYDLLLNIFVPERFKLKEIKISIQDAIDLTQELREELQTPLTPFKLRRGELFQQLKEELEAARVNAQTEIDKINEQLENIEKRQETRKFFTQNNFLSRYIEIGVQAMVRAPYRAAAQKQINDLTNLQLRLIENFRKDVAKINAEALAEINRQLLQFSGSRKSTIMLAELDLKKSATDLKAFIEEAVTAGILSRRKANRLLIQLELDLAANIKKIRDDIRNADLEAVRETFAEEKTQIENINDAYHEAQKTLDKLRADDLIDLEQYNADRAALGERYRKALNEAYLKEQDEEKAREAERIARREEQINQEVDLVNAAQDEIIDARRRSLESETDIFIERQELLLAYAEFARSVELGLNGWSESLRDKAADAEGKRRDRLRKTYKTVALAELAIGSAGAIADIWTKYAQEKAAIALTSVANPALALIRSRIALVRAIAGTTLVGVQTGIAQQKIRSERLGGGSTAGVGGGGTDSSPLFAGAQRGIPSIAAPQINTGTGINPTQQLADTLSGITNKPIRAYVVSSDISSQQALDRRTGRAATFS